MLLNKKQMEWFVKNFYGLLWGKGELYKFSCILEKMCYIKCDEGVHCGAQPGGIRPSSFFIN